MFEKHICELQIIRSPLNPPYTPCPLEGEIRGTLKPFPPLLRGGRGDLPALSATDPAFSNILLPNKPQPVTVPFDFAEETPHANAHPKARLRWLSGVETSDENRPLARNAVRQISS